MFIGYIKNTDDKEDYKEQNDRIMAFAKDNSITLSSIYVDALFDNVKSIISSDINGIIISNIAVIGTSLPAIRDFLYFCKENNVSICSVAENYQFTKERLTDELLQGLDLAIDIRYNMTSVVTKKALAKKKENGVKLGRVSKVNKESILYNKESELIRLLNSGMPKVHIAKQLGICVASIYNFLNLNEDYRNTYIKGASNG